MCIYTLIKKCAHGIYAQKITLTPPPVYSGSLPDRLTSRGMIEFLVSEDNNILDLSHLDQHMDMNMPLSHYFINSSHNTYLTG